jgi:hypothetical protein
MPVSVTAYRGRAPDGMRFLLPGGTGQVARELQSLSQTGVDVIAPSRSELDLHDPRSITRIFAAEPWNMIINAAAYIAMNMRFGAVLLRNTMPLAVAGRRRAARGVNPPP